MFDEPVSWSSKPNSLFSMSRLLSVTSMPWLRIEPRLSKIDARPGDRRSERARDDRVLRLLVVVRELERRAAVEQRHVEARLELAGVFRLEVRVTECADANARVHRRRRSSPWSTRRSARRPWCSAARRTRRTFRGRGRSSASSSCGKKLSSDMSHDSADLRVEHALERLTERAVAVVAHGRR